MMGRTVRQATVVRQAIVEPPVMTAQTVMVETVVPQGTRATRATPAPQAITETLEMVVLKETQGTRAQQETQAALAMAVAAEAVVADYRSKRVRVRLVLRAIRPPVRVEQAAPVVQAGG